MPQEGERIYTIPLGKVLLSPDNRRAKRAINMIREFARRHMKTEDVRIDEDVAHQVWSRGIRRPPRRLRVRMEKTDEGFILVSRYDGEAAGGGGPAAPEAGGKRGGGKDGPVISMTMEGGMPKVDVVRGTDEEREKIRGASERVRASIMRGEAGPGAEAGAPEDPEGAGKAGGAADAGADDTEGGGAPEDPEGAGKAGGAADAGAEGADDTEGGGAPEEGTAKGAGDTGKEGAPEEGTAKGAGDTGKEGAPAGGPAGKKGAEEKGG